MNGLELLQNRMNRSRQNLQRYNDRLRRSPVVSYVNRDPITGHRNMVRPDGGVDMARKLDNANPDRQPGWYLEGTLGFPAQISSKPV